MALPRRLVWLVRQHDRHGKEWISLGHVRTVCGSFSCLGMLRFVLYLQIADVLVQTEVWAFVWARLHKKPSAMKASYSLHGDWHCGALDPQHNHMSLIDELSASLLPLLLHARFETVNPLSIALMPTWDAVGLDGLPYCHWKTPESLKTSSC